jgi:hypothetical protein
MPLKQPNTNHSNPNRPVNDMEVLKETDLNFLGPKKAGKVRDIYDQGDKLILITTDRHSSFDRIIAHVPWKGQVLNQVSDWWFDKTRDIIGNHVLAIPDPNVTVAKKFRMVPVEAVMRGYLTGVTDTSIWTRYSAGKRDFGGLVLPDGMKKNQRLPGPIFDPTTKEDSHDRALTPTEMIAEGFITAELFERLRETALAIFARQRARGSFLWIRNTNLAWTRTMSLYLSMKFTRLTHLDFGSLRPMRSASKKVKSRSISIKNSCVCGLRSTAIRTKMRSCPMHRRNW